MSHKDPVLRSGSFGNRKVVAWGGLHMIKSNGQPYFSLTMGSWVNGREDAFGAAHEELVKLWPELKPLADLHLSSIDGVPMYAAENGWYYMAGAIPEIAFYVRYHLGNSKINIKDEYREPNPDECLAVFAQHARVSFDEAAALREELRQVYCSVSHYMRVYEGGGVAEARAALAKWIDEQKPRWKREADECIRALGLVVYGDAYQPEAEPAKA